MSREQMEKDRNDCLATLQKVEQELGRLGTLRANLHGAIAVYDKQLAAETAPAEAPNRAARRRAAKIES